MANSQPSHAASTQVASNTAAGWTAVALPLIVLLASFLGGSTARWSEGIVLAGFGLLLLARPPRLSLGAALNVIALLFFALAAMAFLPAEWFHVPAWRIALTKDFGVQLPGTVSVQPWLTLDSGITLLAGFAWLYYVTTAEIDLRDVRRAARFFAAGIIALAALAIFLHLRDGSLPFWHNVRNFGPYPNRNQTGDLFGISTLIVLACLEDDIRRGRWRGLFWLGGVGVLVAALIFNFSRAGILILVLGTVAWLVRLAFRKWSGAAVAIAVSVFLLLIGALLLFGGATIARFHFRLGGDAGVASDYRLLIFRDALAMIHASPWCGLGLGNFESVFALFRDASAAGARRSLHPESDWLWLASELGWPGVVLVLAAFALFVRRIFPLQEGTNQRLRYAALLGALLFALHGLVDVSAHRFGTFLAGTFLLGLAQHRPVSCAPRRWLPIAFRLVGVVLIVAGVTWFFSWRQERLVPGRLGVENAKRAAAFANRGHRFEEAIGALDRGLVWAPLDWELYFVRGVSRIGLRRPDAEAVADFRRARFLEPSAWQLPFEEGKTWLTVQPTYALSAWREAMRRRADDPGALYSQMFALAGDYDARVLARLGDFAVGDPGLTITWLENLPGKKFPAALAELRARDPALAEFDPAQKTRLFALWAMREQLDELARAVQEHPDWAPYAWPGLARWQASRGAFAEAWALVRQYARPPALPEATNALALAQLEQELYRNPGDYAVGYALYRAQTAAGKRADALATVRHFTARSDAPAYFYYLQAQAWAAQENYERAWRSWESYQSVGERR